MLKSIFFYRYRLLSFALLSMAGAQLLSAQTTYESMRAGDAAYNRSNFSKAEPHYRRVTEKEPANWNASYNLGNALYQQGKYDDAAEVFEKAVGNAPSSNAKADVLYNAGNALLKQNKFKEAVKAYESSLRLRPGDPDAKMNLQMAKKKDKQEEERKKQEQKDKQDQQNQDQNQDQQDQNQDQKKQDEQKDQQQQQQQKDQQQEKQQNQQQPSEPKQQPASEQQVKQQEARRILETRIGPEDRKNARKYRSAEQKKAPRSGKKDW